MPIFYAYNSQPAAGQPGHKGTELLLLPYTKSPTIFQSPLDVGGPYLSQDPGLLAGKVSATAYFQAYGTSYRFGHCMFSTVAGESSQNNVPYLSSQLVTEGSIAAPSDTRVIRIEMMPFFARSSDPGCARYGYDCDPVSYFQSWGKTGGSVIFSDGHAKKETSAGQFDENAVNPEGRRSGEPSADASAWSRTWYSLCD